MLSPGENSEAFITRNEAFFFLLTFKKNNFGDKFTYVTTYFHRYTLILATKTAGDTEHFSDDCKLQLMTNASSIVIYNGKLTHLCLMAFTTLFNCANPFRI